VKKALLEHQLELLYPKALSKIRIFQLRPRYEEEFVHYYLGNLDPHEDLISQLSALFLLSRNLVTGLRFHF
jgi:hypothetical protein